MDDFSQFTRRWLPVAIWMLVILVFSTDLGSLSASSRLFDPIFRWFDPKISASELYAANIVIRKIGHVLEFVILALLVWRTRDFLSAPWRAGGYLRLTGFVLLVSAFFAISSELVQYAAKSRGASPRDVLLDMAGATLGLLVIFSIKLTRRASRGTK